MPWLRSLIALVLSTTLVSAASWPGWLGPRRDGSTPEKVAPWKEDPKLLWSHPVGEGHSSPVVVGGQVFLFTKAADRDAEELTAYDAVKGTKLWSQSYSRPPFQTPFGNGPRSTPAVAAGKVNTLGATGLLTCFDAKKGTQLWQVDTLTKYKSPNLTFGIACSPLIDGDRVVVNIGKNASVAAFDRKTGAPIWTSQKDAASYSSPVLFHTDIKRQLVTLTQQGVVSLDPNNGQLYWKFPLVDLLNESSTTPVRVGNIVLASSVTFGSVGLKIGEKDGKPTVSQAWKNGALTCYFGTPVAVGKEHVYMVTGALLVPSATLRCIEASSGKQLWSRPKVGKYHATLIRTGDDRLLMLEEGGDLVLIDPSPRGYKELARSKVCGQTWAHPALAGGRIYLRDAKQIICRQLAP